MKVLAEIVANAVGTSDPSEIDAIVAADGSGVLERLASAYDRWKRPSAPKKRADEFVPGWRLNSTSFDNAWGQDGYFVVRAILYAHRIALVDPLWFHLYPLGPIRTPSAGFGFKENLAKVLHYAPLERAGLLFYVPPGVPPEPDNFFATEYSDEELETYFREYLAPRGQYRRVADDEWTSKTGDAFSARLAANLELAAGLYGASTLLDWQRANARSLDLYVPEEPMYRDALEWLIRRDGSGLLTGQGNPHDSQAMRALWALPTPSIEKYQELTIKDLAAIREEDTFSAWRQALTSALKAFVVSKAIGEDAEAVLAFNTELQARRDETVAAARSSRLFNDMAGAAGLFGLGAVVSGGLSLLLNVDPTAGTLTATASAAVASAPRGFRVAKSLATGTPRKRAVHEHFQLFGSVHVPHVAD